MIRQIAHVPQKTAQLPTINKGLIQARHIQAKLKQQAEAEDKPDRAIFWNSTAQPYLVPIIRWIE